MQLATPRIPRVEDDRATEVVSLFPGEGVQNAAVAIAWDDGAWYFTHRDAETGTDAVSRVTMDGEVTPVFSGIINGQAGRPGRADVRCCRSGWQLGSDGSGCRGYGEKTPRGAHNNVSRPCADRAQLPVSQLPYR